MMAGSSVEITSRITTWESFSRSAVPIRCGVEPLHLLCQEDPTSGKVC